LNFPTASSQEMMYLNFFEKHPVLKNLNQQKNKQTISKESAVISRGNLIILLNW